jgi:hypothetical protein
MLAAIADIASEVHSLVIPGRAHFGASYAAQLRI